MEPISTYPKPRLNNGSMTSPCLSKPAAIPIGLDSFFPKTSTSSTGSSISENKRGYTPDFNKSIPSLWPCSASVSKRIRGHHRYSFAADLASKEYAPKPIAQTRRKVELGNGRILDCSGVLLLELKHLFKAREE